jgi:hypothetical protein
VGYELVKLTVHAELSRHNTQRDDDNAAWNELVAHVDQIVSESRFAGIRPLLDASDPIE